MHPHAEQKLSVAKARNPQRLQYLMSVDNVDKVVSPDSCFSVSLKALPYEERNGALCLGRGGDPYKTLSTA